MATKIEYDLPVSKCVLSREITGIVDKLARFISPGINPSQFLAMVVAEGNALGQKMSDQEMQDPRTILSFMKAAFNAAVVGLLPGAALGHAYFIPFKRNWNKPASQQYTEIQYIPGYKGFLELAFANRFLVQCDPEVVLTGEECVRTHTEDGPKLVHHIPSPRGQVPDRSNVVGVYCTYRTSRGGRGVVFLERSEIDKVDKNKDIWQSDYLAMCYKTPIRRAAKRWQVTRQLAGAIALDEAADRDELQPALVELPEAAEATSIDLDALGE